MPTLHLIEPTLFDQTGHGYSYTKTLIQASQTFKFQIHLWLDRRGKNLFRDLPCVPHLFFIRKFRQIQKVWLYAKLLKQRSAFYICTAEQLDLILLNYLSYFLKPKKHNIFLHFHQFNKTEKKLNTLKKISDRNPFFTILTPTQALTQIFKAAGFKHTQTLPCPSFTPQPKSTIQKPYFEKVLYAGAARADKGFPKVVELLQMLNQQKKSLPFVIQISKPNSNRYDPASQQAHQTLQQITFVNNNIQLYANTLTQTEYQALFENAICLLLYDPQSYHNKFSGVALDAFYAGAPILTTADTWIAQTVLRFQAGLVLENNHTDTIFSLIQKIKNNYHTFSQNALHAGAILQKEHDPKNTLAFLATHISRRTADR